MENNKQGKIHQFLNSTKVRKFREKLSEFRAKVDVGVLIKKHPTIMLYSISFFVVVVLFFATFFIIDVAFLQPVNIFDNTPTQVNIAKNSSLKTISKQLEKQGIIKNASVFKYYVEFSDYSSKLKSGSYILKKSMNMDQIIKTMASGGISDAEVSVTLSAGMTATDIAQRLKQAGVISDADAFLESCNNLELFSKVKTVEALDKTKAASKKTALEGYLYPETYVFFTNALDEYVINKMLSQFETVMTKEWEEKAKQLNMTVDDIVTMASIIEKEAKPKDYAKVSAILHNKIKAGQKLESPATIRYATGSKRLALTDDEKAVTSPYNTYVQKGLPPGAIGNPDIAAIQAALNPDMDFINQKYLYFVLENPNTGELDFSKTQAGQQKALDRNLPKYKEYDKNNGL